MQYSKELDDYTNNYGKPKANHQKSANYTPKDSIPSYMTQVLITKRMSSPLKFPTLYQGIDNSGYKTIAVWNKGFNTYFSKNLNDTFWVDLCAIEHDDGLVWSVSSVMLGDQHVTWEQIDDLP